MTGRLEKNTNIFQKSDFFWFRFRGNIFVPLVKSIFAIFVPL